MSDKTTILRAFNSQFFEFVDDIIRTFPEKRELKDAKTAFETFKKLNPTSIMKAWLKYVYTPYKDDIESGNIDYFINKDYSNDLTNLTNAGDIMKTIDVLREPIRTMSDENKNCCIKYIQTLCKVSEIYSKFI